jgi:uncharacterized membrane protein YidH (DUF202 family)
VLIGVRAEAYVEWASNKVIEKYRFYYPYQELLLTSTIADPQEEAQIDKSKGSSSLLVELLLAVIVILVVALLVVGTTKCVRRYYKVPRLLNEEELPEGRSGGVELNADYSKYGVSSSN